ncbi:hypothetical protein VCUG_01168 [Vavraia culicis subsp. floridensis]|uniref:Divalent-cation tolerance protein CutA n=1 Tax=Vavraia culicis (isolate floridensis) TaxID=948595 RepID=L2GUW3_VAVCU|nr:uncharacterized protein VCUG_01168 [Vavraia culicis subsp. floridensis]ELA47399.1 hypothetical protein VCUG_01168 [Vavraia culicis subsp. floridensis]
MDFPIIIFTTFPNEKEADSILKTLLDKKLVACAQKTFQVESKYLWNGRVETDREVQTKMTTFHGYIPQIERVMSEMHSYDVYQFIVVKLDYVNEKYLKWMKEVIDSNKE